LAACSIGVLIRVPDSKSIPKLIPLPAIASEPITRITPDIEKNHFDLPMKSNVHGRPSPWAPSAKREFSNRVRLSDPMRADVNRTAVKSDVRVPTPSVNAKPLMPAVASMKRMNATPIVQTFASMIVRRAFV
jgi:hypothetical protein